MIRITAVILGSQITEMNLSFISIIVTCVVNSKCDFYC